MAARGVRLVFIAACWIVLVGHIVTAHSRVVTPPESVSSAKQISVINLDLPLTRTVYQRDSNNRAIIPVRGRFSGEADLVQLRLIPRSETQRGGAEWQTVINRGTSGTLRTSTAATGGWYNLEIRALAGSTIVATGLVERVGVGEVFVVVGHSVAAGQDENMEGADDDRVNTVAVDQESRAFKKYLETGSPTDLPEAGFCHFGSGVAPAPFGHGNYFWSKFGELLAKQENVPVLIYNAAFGGTSLEHWSKSAQGIPFQHSFVKSSIGMPYINLQNTLNKYVPLTGLRAILADQGQNDWAEKNEEKVFRNFSSWLELARLDLNHPALAAVINRQMPFLRDVQIRRVQERMAASLHCFPGPDYDSMTDLDRPDKIHLSIGGQRKAARLWAAALNRQFFQNSKPWLPDFR